MKLTVARVVAAATPVFAAVAGVGSAWLAAHFPGLPKFDPAEITVFLTAGATAAGGAAVKFLHGQSAWERLERTLDSVFGKATTEINTIDPGVVKKLEEALLAEGSGLEAKVVSLISNLHVTVGKPPAAPLPAIAVADPAPVVEQAPAA